jgi:hypothetical protein
VVDGTSLENWHTERYLGFESLTLCNLFIFIGMMLQLNPMIPIIRVSDKMEGYAFLVIDYSQEHNLLFTCAMDDGEIWTLSNHDIRFCKNISLDRNEVKI